ncbi:tail fiber domain-containing protein [Paenibacillus rhizoplanae]
MLHCRGAITVDEGNVGIGTDDRAAKLEVKGNAVVSGSLTVTEASLSGGLEAASAKISGLAALKDVTVSGGFTAQDAAITGSLTLSKGIAVDRGTDQKAQLLWDEAQDVWTAGIAGSMKQLSYSGHTHQELSELTGVLKIASGNVGIGTAAPTAKLEVNGNAAVSGGITVTDAAVSGTLTSKRANVSGVLTATDAEVSGTFSAKDAAVTGSLTLSQGINVGRGTGAKAQIVWNEALAEWQMGLAGSLKQLSYSGHTHKELTDLNAVLKVASGNIGIGTAAPAAKLDVNGNAAVSGKLTVTDADVNGSLTAKDAVIDTLLKAADAEFTGMFTAKDAAFTGTLSAKDLTLGGTVNVKDAKISGSLTVTRGIELDRGKDKKAQILWDATANAWQAGIEGSMQKLVCQDSVYDELVQVADVLTLDSSSNIGIGKAPADNYKLDVNGNLRATNFAQTSSRTYKENIASLPVKKALELLNKLKPVTFNYKTENGKQQNIGFIAEDVPQIFLHCGSQVCSADGHYRRTDHGSPEAAEGSSRHAQAGQ